MALLRRAASGARVRSFLLAAAAASAASGAGAQNPPVVITGTRFAEPADALPFGATVITAHDLERGGFTTVTDALMHLAGINGRVDLTGGGEYTLDLRGFGSTADANQVIVVDGMRVSEADFGGTRLTSIPIDSIERIEVLRGAGAVLYGEGATAGVIVITTKAGAARSGGSATATLGSHRQRELRADATLVAGEFALEAAGNRRLTDGWRANFASAAGDALIGLKWQHEQLSIIVKHADDRLESGLPGALTADQFAADPWQAGTPDDHASLHARRTTLQAAWKLDHGWSFALDGGWRDKESRSWYASFGGSYDYDIDAGQWSVRAHHVGNFGSASNSFAAGIDDNRWQRDVLGAFGSQATQTNHAVFVRDQLTLPGGARLVAGLRREWLHKSSVDAFSRAGLDDSVDAWELAALQPLDADWQLYARAGRSFRLANADEFAFTSPGAILRPQISHDAELGLRWRRAADAIELRLYRSALTDEIGFDPAAAGPFGPGANVNFDPTRRQGVEFEGRHALSAHWSISAAAAWRRSYFVAGPYAGRDVPLVVPRNAAIGADAQVAPGQRVSAWLRVAAAQPVDFTNACRLPGFAAVDARWAWRIEAAEISLGATNLFDRRYATQAFACTGDGRATSIYPEPGRAFSAAARWFF